MKKVLNIFLGIIVITLFLTGCSSSTNNELLSNNNTAKDELGDFILTVETEKILNENVINLNIITKLKYVGKEQTETISHANDYIDIHILLNGEKKTLYIPDLENKETILYVDEMHIQNYDLSIKDTQQNEIILVVTADFHDSNNQRHIIIFETNLAGE